jgi:transposase-like protein
VTEQVWAEVVDWQQRPLKAFYAATFLDRIWFTSREGGKSAKKVVYSVYGVNAEGSGKCWHLHPWHGGRSRVTFQ